jgi:hypothetical protein
VSGWSNPEVTPVGQPAPPPPPTGAPYVPPPAPPPAPPADPFGSRPSGRRLGRVRLVLGILVTLAGAVAVTIGIVQAVAAGQDISGSTLGAGAVGEGVSEPVVFDAPAAGDYTIYARFDGLLEEEDTRRERTIGDISCEAALPDGQTARFRGARQGNAVSIGEHSTIGWFSTAPGEVTVTCTYDGLGRTRLTRADEVELVAVEGKPSVTEFLVLAGGITGLVLGIMLAVWGATARHRRW